MNFKNLKNCKICRGFCLSSKNNKIIPKLLNLSLIIREESLDNQVLTNNLNYKINFFKIKISMDLKTKIINKFKITKI